MRVAFMLALGVLLLAAMPPSRSFARGRGAAQAELQERAGALLARARAVSDLEAEGNPPFVFRGRVWLHDLQDGSLEGSYRLVWASPEHWRAEIRIGTYQETAIATPEALWRQRSQAYQPYRIYQLEQLLGLSTGLNLQAQEEVVEVGEKEWQGAQWKYVQTALKSGGREFWFDPATGTLAREKHDWLEDMSAFEYGDYAAVRSRLFPRSLRLVQFGKLVVEVRAEELTAVPEPSTVLFHPPRGAQSWPRCDRPSPPKAVRSPAPKYPWRARRIRSTGVARAYVVVGPDGLIHYSSVLRTPGVEFTSAVKKVLPRWRFRPAMCHGAPVEFPIFVEFAFSTTPIR